MVRELLMTPEAVARRERDRDRESRRARGEVIERGAAARHRPLLDDPSEPSPLSSAGGVRRLRALMALGFTPGVIGEHLQCQADVVWLIALSAPIYIAPGTQQAIARVYDSLARRPTLADGSPAGRAAVATFAAHCDWKTPAVWTDIDSPSDPPAPVQATGAFAELLVRAGGLEADLAATKRQLAAEKRRADKAEARVGARAQARYQRERADGLASRLATQGAALKRETAERLRVEGELVARIDSAQHLSAAQDELRRVREELRVARLVGQPVTLRLGKVAIAGELREVVVEPRPLARVRIAGAASPREFSLADWDIEASSALGAEAQAA